jgi:hypothetical protein
LNDIQLAEFRKAIRATHGCESVFRERVPVEEYFRGRPVWSGTVLAFDLLNHPSASVCYAWEIDGKVTAVLGVPPVHSAADAVRAAIAGQHRSGS